MHILKIGRCLCYADMFDILDSINPTILLIIINNHLLTCTALYLIKSYVKCKKQTHTIQWHIKLI